MILNLTQHDATAEQLAGGVVDLAGDAREGVRQLLTFPTPPSAAEMGDCARSIAYIARLQGAKCAMIGGAPFFMPTLERVLEATGIQVLYAFSVRESVEEALPDGSIKKSSRFRHAGFVSSFI